MGKHFHKILYIILMAAFAIVFIQTSWHPINVKPLKNDPKNAKTPQFSIENYKNGKFQRGCENYLKDNYGFREFGMRLYNQYLYSFYKITCNSFFCPGKDNWMYYHPGVKDYYGTEFYSNFRTNDDMVKYIDNQVDMLNELRSILKNEYDIELLSFIAPDKPFIYPQHLPDMEKDSTTINAAEYFSKKFKETGFPNIDMIPWYKAIADTSSRNLFMPMDTHWTFASFYGYDSLFRFMNSLNDFGIPTMRLDSISETKYKGRQDDEATLNLLFKVPNDTPLYTSHISVESDSTSRKPRVLFIGDSFIFAFEAYIPKTEIISYYENWYYFNKAFKGFSKKTYNVKDINRLRSILNVDYVVLYASGHQWYKGAMGFVEDVLPSIKNPEEVEVALMMNEIENKPDMMEMISKKAKDKGISVEKMLELDAKWIIEHKNSEK